LCPNSHIAAQLGADRFTPRGLLQEKQFHILSTDVVKVKSSRVSNVISISPSQIGKLGFTRGFTRKGLQSRSATASLLIISYKCMKEEIKLIAVLAQKSRHTVETCGMKQRCIISSERDHVWMGAVKKGHVAHLVCH